MISLFVDIAGSLCPPSDGSPCVSNTRIGTAVQSTEPTGDVTWVAPATEPSWCQWTELNNADWRLCRGR